MKILVPLKRVVDYNVKVRPLPDNTNVDLNNVKMSVNPFCEIALEEAVRIKEAGNAEEVIAVTTDKEGHADRHQWRQYRDPCWNHGDLGLLNHLSRDFEIDDSGTCAHSDYAMEDPFAVRSTRGIGEIIDAQ